MSDEPSAQSSQQWKVKNESEQEEMDMEQDSVVRSKFPSAFRGEIPDAKTVYEARKKREKMRLVGSNGQIPLDDVKRLKDKSVARSRLIREDENDLSDEDAQGGRFYSLKSLTTDDDERRRSDHMDFLIHEGGGNNSSMCKMDESFPNIIDSDGNNDQSDEEVTRWEREQMKKGVSSHKVEMLERERAKMEAVMKAIRSSMELPAENREQLPMEMDIDFSETDMLSTSQGYWASVWPDKIVSLKGILTKLQQRKKDGKESVDARKAEFEKTNIQIQENKEMIGKLEMEEPRIRERFQVYQDMRAYARDLLECLSEKISEVKDLEYRMAEILDGRARRLRIRRRNDVHDMYDECSAAAAGRPLHQRAPEITQRAAEREARRSRRRRMRENTLEGVSHEEGLSTDDEETNSEIVVRQQSIDEIRAAANVVFVDALDDFCHTDRILSRFVDWLAQDEESFTNAYIHLCIPKLISLFIRLELIDWGPLENDNRQVNSMRWYEDLITCAATSSNVNFEHPVIVSLIPLCIEKVVLWKITGAVYIANKCYIQAYLFLDLIRERWDPLSQHQCRNLGFLLSQLIDECPTLVPTSRSVQKLLQTICLRAQDAIDEDLFVPIYSKQAVENLATGCKAFLDRQTWTSVKLIRCLSCLSSIISEEKMRELVLDGIINRMIPALQCATISDQSMIRKCRALMKLVPTAWREDNTRIALRNFNDLLGKRICQGSEEIRHCEQMQLIVSSDNRDLQLRIMHIGAVVGIALAKNHLLAVVLFDFFGWNNSNQLWDVLQQVLNVRSHLSQLCNDFYEESLLAERAEANRLQEDKLRRVNSLFSQAKQAKMNTIKMKKLACDIENLNEMIMQLVQLVRGSFKYNEKQIHLDDGQSLLFILMISAIFYFVYSKLDNIRLKSNLVGWFKFSLIHLARIPSSTVNFGRL
ncbi:hypothetical protein DINM_004190 [Dirofilaria immitis]|nr:hypothetical protein [Dirofilaria immitis]